MGHPTFIPMSGGNLFSTSAYLQAIGGYDSNAGRYYLLQRDYYANEGDIEGNEEIKDLWPLLMAFRCDLGQVGLAKIGDKFGVIGGDHLVTDQGNKVEEGTGYTLYNMGNYDSKNLGSAIKLNSENSVLCKFNSYALPLYGTQIPVIETMKLYLDANKTNAVTSIAKKIIVHTQNANSQIVELEMKNILDPANPGIINITNPQSYFGNHNLGSGLQGLESSQDISLPNKIERLDLGDGKGNLLEGGDAFSSALGFGYSHFGRIENVNEKSERLVVGETNNSNANIKIVKNERDKYLKQFVEQCNRLGNLNLKLVEVAPVQMETSGNINEKKGEENDIERRNENI